jgi:TPP-dependent indolepyruvate ferredoxin oxidoreductase alpha subunit
MIVSYIIAQALLDASVKVINYVPGYGGSAIYRALQKLTGEAGFVSFHEEVSFAVAHGAAVTGTRSACLFKTHGIMKAGNAVSDSLLCGVNAGLVAIISEDHGGTHSDSIIEAKPFLDGIGMPNFITHPDTVYEDVHRAFHMSEEAGLPYALILDAADATKEASFTPYKSACSALYERNPARHALLPLFNPYQYQVYKAKMRGDDWHAIPVPVTPVIPRDAAPNWKAAIEGYVPLFEVFRKYRGTVVTGDTGISSQFCADPWQCVDIVSYMGGSIPLAMGAYLSGNRNVWAVTGDFSFISAGATGLLEAVLRKIPLKVMIISNGIAATTGGQRIPEGTLEFVLSPWREYLRFAPISDKGKMEEVIREASLSETLKIVVINF